MYVHSVSMKERLLTTPINREPQAESKSHAEVKASSADIHNILRKTELRTLLRSKNRLFFSTQINGTQRSTQRKHPFLFRAKRFLAALHAAKAYICC